MSMSYKYVHTYFKKVPNLNFNVAIDMTQIISSNIIFKE